MADISDVLNALADLVTTSFYPNGTVDANGNAILSTAGTVAKVMRGTPFAKQLDDDLRAGTINVTINERMHVGRTTTRFFSDWSAQSLSEATIRTATSGNMLTLGGSVTPGQGIMIVVDGQPYAYQFQTNDTLASIAADLAASVSVDQAATANGAVLTIPGARRITARSVVTGVATRPTRQQTAGLMVKIFAPNFELRDVASALVDAYLATVPRMVLTDGTVAMLRYSGTTYDDQTQKSLNFIRCLLYQAEYSTMQTMVETTVGVMEAALIPRAPGGQPGPMTIATDVGPPVGPRPSDLNVNIKSNEVIVDPYGNPEIRL